jgi:hypothetical protein
MGPKKISDRRVTDAKKYLGWIMREFEKIQEKEDWDVDDVVKNPEIARILKRFRPSVELKDFWREIEDEIEHMDPMTDKQVDSVIDDFVHLWTKGSSRDISSRDIDGNRQVWVCGGTSHGESPSDFFDEVTRLQAFGVLEVLGVA